MAHEQQPKSSPIPHNPSINPKPNPRVCFSFAAYAKNLIDQLHHSNIQIAPGLIDSEFAQIESTFHFNFPPDLCSILREGLPVDHGFPNWRSSSTQQLQILIDLPVLNLLRKIKNNGFWCDNWGRKPEDNGEAVELANLYLRKVPVLVPIYRNCYIPAIPCLAGNPVFYVNGEEVKVWSYDICGFFQQVEFLGNGEILRRPTLSNLLNAPAWAATAAREIEFWSATARGGGGGRWWGGGELGGCLEEVCERLRDGGWGEDDVREMMMMDGCDQKLRSSSSSSSSDGDDNRGLWMRDREGVVEHMRLLSETLVRAGWSAEDVVDLLDLGGGNNGENHINGANGDSNWLDFQHNRQLNTRSICSVGV